MRIVILFAFPALLACEHFDRASVGPVSIPIEHPHPPSMSFHALSATSLNGELVRMDQYKGKKIIIVNTASECGFTKQFAQLQELYAEYEAAGLVILGFPSNDFGGQEPGSEEEIGAFCQKNYGVTFPMMSKVSIKGDEIHPVYHWLTNKSQNGVMDASVKWNFNKFLIDEDGRLVDHFGSGVEPLDEAIRGWVKGDAK